MLYKTRAFEIRKLLRKEKLTFLSADFLGFGLAAGGFFEVFEHDDIPESRLGALIKTFFFFLVFGGGGGGTGKRPVNEDMF